MASIYCALDFEFNSWLDYVDRVRVPELAWKIAGLGDPPSQWYVGLNVTQYLAIQTFHFGNTYSLKVVTT